MNTTELNNAPAPRSVDQQQACYAVFTGQGGYPGENEKANATFKVGERYVITGGAIGQSSSHLVIEGFDGSWNSVLFDFDWQGAPLDFPYLTARHNASDQTRRAQD
jgi:hypothetical protein